MTKLVTATAVLQLADRGQLELDMPVANFVPEFPTRDGGSRVTSWDYLRLVDAAIHAAG